MTPPAPPRRAADLAIACSLAFLAILALLHGLEPEFDPRWRMISEYELGRHGWLMSLAFWCWGAAVFALRAALGGRIGRLASGWFGLLGLALVGAGAFLTYPITAPRVDLPSGLHNLCGAIVILTFPVAATLAARRLPGERAVAWATGLCWLGLAAFFGVMIATRVLHPEAGRVGPDVPIGWPNRFMVACYHVWLLAAARASRRGPAT